MLFNILWVQICGSGSLPPKNETRRCKILHHGHMWNVRSHFLVRPAALTRSTSLSISEVSEGKCRLTRSATLSFKSKLGPASLSPSPEDWTTGTKDRCSRTSLRKSARPPEPARTSQGMLFLRERSTLWYKKESLVSSWKAGTLMRKKIQPMADFNSPANLQHARSPWHQHTNDRNVNAATTCTQERQHFNYSTIKHFIQLNDFIALYKILVCCPEPLSLFF